MSETIKEITECTLCQQRFEADRADIPVIGEHPSSTVIRIVHGLKKHLEKNHPREINTIKDLAQNFYGYLVTSHFETRDMHLALNFDIARAGLHKMTRRPIQVPDGAIREQLAKMGLSGEQLEAVSLYVRNVRDAYDEEGIFSAEAHRTAVLQQSQGPVLVSP
jgi:hypothetical protein